MWVALKAKKWEEGFFQRVNSMSQSKERRQATDHLRNWKSIAKAQGPVKDIFRSSSDPPTYLCKELNGRKLTGHKAFWMITPFTCLCTQCSNDHIWFSASLTVIPLMRTDENAECLLLKSGWYLVFYGAFLGKSRQNPWIIDTASICQV